MLSFRDALMHKRYSDGLHSDRSFMVPQSTLMVSPPRAPNGISTAGVHDGDANGISAPDGFYFATAELAARAVAIHEE